MICIQQKALTPFFMLVSQRSDIARKSNNLISPLS